MIVMNNRQSFLGDKLEEVLENCKVGVVGLGGGGSQIVQQLAHIGFKNYVLFDDDSIEDTNLNRLVGATKLDVELGLSKMAIATRLIRGLKPDASIIKVQKKWQEEPQTLIMCDIVFGCLDGYQNREQLEALTRRYLIPYVDIGMDVYVTNEGKPRMAGQVIASIPGFPCMKCLSFINDTALSKEVKKYGAAGVRPQVIWANGVLASTAVGMAINLLTNWTGQCEDMVLYYEYDGNKQTIKPHLKNELRKIVCTHYELSNIGDVQL